MQTNNYELNSLARLYENKGDYEVAQHLLGQSIKLKIQVYGDNYSGHSDDLYRLGLLRIAVNDHKGAKQFFVRALKAAKNSFAKPNKIAGILKQFADLFTINIYQLKNTKSKQGKLTNGYQSNN